MQKIVKLSFFLFLTEKDHFWGWMQQADQSFASLFEFWSLFFGIFSAISDFLLSFLLFFWKKDNSFEIIPAKIIFFAYFFLKGAFSAAQALNMPPGT